MANVTYTGAVTPSLVVSSSGSINPCDSREPPLPGNIGISVPGGYDLMTYQRLASVLYAHPSPPTHMDPSSTGPAPPTPPGHPSLLPGQDHLLHGGSLELKDGLGGLSPAWPYTMYYPYDTLAAYPFAHGYGMTFDAARRKNATRETTATLKAWLNEHKKNPYPTKGEKIMLAIITKMTLTQVSTWFANARRRLKKENKMTWEPRNKTDDDDDDDDYKDDVSSDNERRKDLESGERTRDDDSEANGDDRMDRSSSPPRLSPHIGGVHCNPNNGHSISSPVKPRIWSLADMAASSSTSSSSSPAVIGASKLLHRPIHLETSPYGRPMPPLNARLASPQEALLQVYAKSLGLPPHAAAAFPPLNLNGFGGPLVHHPPISIGDPLPPSLISHSLTPASLSASFSSCSPLQLSISKPIATRPPHPVSPIYTHSHHTLPGGAKITPAPPSSPSSPLSPINDV